VKSFYITKEDGFEGIEQLGKRINEIEQLGKESEKYYSDDEIFAFKRSIDFARFIIGTNKFRILNN